MTRAATIEDIPRLVQLGAMLHAESPAYRDTPYVPRKVAALLEALINGAGVVFVAEREGMVVGGMAGGVCPQWFNDDLYGFDYSLFLEPGSRHGITTMRLLTAFVFWCRAKGAKRITVGITTAIQLAGTTRLYERVGFVQSGNLFVMEI